MTSYSGSIFTGGGGGGGPTRSLLSVTHEGMVLEILNLDDGWFAIAGGVGDLNGTLPRQTNFC